MKCIFCGEWIYNGCFTNPITCPNCKRTFDKYTEEEARD